MAAHGFSLGDVVLAKYGKTPHFFWAKVLRIYGRGNGLCDVCWLRPQAGATVGPAYTLAHGYDETMEGERISISADTVRRPSAADLIPAAAPPPGAGASAARSMAAPNVAGAGSAKTGSDLADLLGQQRRVL